MVHTCVNDWSLQEQEEFLFRLIEALSPGFLEFNSEAL